MRIFAPFLSRRAAFFFIYLVFLLFGDLVFQKVFRINFESFRIFGGMVLFSFAYIFIVQGKKAFIQIKRDLHDLASEIALPFKVGTGTSSLTALISEQLILWQGILSPVIIVLLNFYFIMGLKQIRHGMRSKKVQTAFDKNMGLLLRINGFFLGAIGTDMIVTSIRNLLAAGLG